MKRFLLLPAFFLLLAAATRSQVVTGVYKGVMQVDSPRNTINFELTLKEKKGKLFGYCYRLFIVGDTLYYNVVQVNARIAKDVLIVEDERSVSNNFEMATRGIKTVFFFNLKDIGNDTATLLPGEWSTSRWRNYLPLTGKIEVTRERNYLATQLYKRLAEKNLDTEMLFEPAAPTEPVLVAAPGKQPPADGTKPPAGGDEGKQPRVKDQPLTMAPVVVPPPPALPVKDTAVVSAPTAAKEPPAVAPVGTAANPPGGKQGAKPDSSTASVPPPTTPPVKEPAGTKPASGQPAQQQPITVAVNKPATNPVTDKKEPTQPATTNPVATKPPATQPVADTKPATGQPAQQQPVTVAANKPATNPVTDKKEPTQPVTTNPVATKPPATQPAADTKPATGQPAQQQPLTVAVNKPATNPVTDKKEPTQPVTNNPVATKPPVTQPAAGTQPASGQPTQQQHVTVAVNKPATNPVTDKKEPTQPTTNNPVATKPPVKTQAQQQPAVAKQQGNQPAPAQTQPPVVQNKPTAPPPATQPAGAVTQQTVNPPVQQQQATSLPILAPTQQHDSPFVKKSDLAVNKLPVISNPLLTKRQTELLETVTVMEDSITLSLYDNGEIDGDTVSVFLNNEVLVSRVGLTAQAHKITIPVPAGQIIQLTLYAENLGKIPPNTGLLVVYSGDRRYQVFFSATLDKSAGILLQRNE